jgi:hypothetical protein
MSTENPPVMALITYIEQKYQFYEEVLTHFFPMASYETMALKYKT